MPPQRECDFSHAMFVPQVLGVGVRHGVEEFAAAVVDREVVEEFAEHEVAVISQSRLVLLNVRKDALLDTAVIETQFKVDQVTWPRFGGKEVIAVVEVQPFEVGPKHRPGSLPKSRSRRDRQGGNHQRKQMQNESNRDDSAKPRTTSPKRLVGVF